MISQTFDERIRCIDRVTPLKLRDPESPIPRGYTIHGREGYFLLISIDGAMNVYFDHYKHLITNKVVRSVSQIWRLSNERVRSLPALRNDG